MTSFEAVSLIISAALLVATASATAIAWSKAIASRNDRERAEAAAQRALTAQEDAAVALRRAADAQERLADAARKDAWGVPRRTTGDGWAIRNSSGKPIQVEELEVDPPTATELVKAEKRLPAFVASGDFLYFTAQSRYTLSVRAISVHWNFPEGDGARHTSVRTLT